MAPTVVAFAQVKCLPGWTVEKLSNGEWKLRDGNRAQWFLSLPYSKAAWNEEQAHLAKGQIILAKVDRDPVVLATAVRWGTSIYAVTKKVDPEVIEAHGPDALDGHVFRRDYDSARSCASAFKRLWETACFDAVRKATDESGIEGQREEVARALRRWVEVGQAKQAVAQEAANEPPPVMLEASNAPVVTRRIFDNAPRPEGADNETREERDARTLRNTIMVIFVWEDGTVRATVDPVPLVSGRGAKARQERDVLLAGLTWIAERKYTTMARAENGLQALEGNLLGCDREQAIRYVTAWAKPKTEAAESGPSKAEVQFVEPKSLPVVPKRRVVSEGADVVDPYAAPLGPPPVDYTIWITGGVVVVLVLALVIVLAK